MNLNPLYAEVALRASHRCEYCRAPEAVFNFPFEVEHIVPASRGGSTSPANHALACRACNRAKGPNLAGRIDDETVPLFHPRHQKWQRHFRWLGPMIVGKTKAGKATVAVLNLNAPERILVRKALIAAGLFPPP